ncbi:MAG: response regulator [Polyangiales bacterium]
MRAKRLLIVDDDEDARFLLGLYFEDLGFEVTATATLAGAISAIAEASFDAVVTDLRLPDGHGHARFEGGRPVDIRFAAALTGLSDPRERDATLRAGFDAHYTKPVDMEALSAAIHARTSA